MAHDDDALHYREKSLMKGMLNRDDMRGASINCRHQQNDTKSGTRQN